MSGGTIHDAIQRAAARFLKRQHRTYPGCAVVLVDKRSGAYEQPDVIGWSAEFSVVVEVKASRADWIRDAKKPHRIYTEGMGNVRWFAAPVGVIHLSELPEGWGLLEFDGRSLAQVVAPVRRSLGGHTSGLFGERIMLVSALRRAAKGGAT